MEDNSIPKMTEGTAPAGSYITPGMQVLMAFIAIALCAAVFWTTRHDVARARRWWPMAMATSFVLLAPLVAACAGFGPKGPVKGSIAADLQSLLATGYLSPLAPVLRPVMSALQSVGAKGLGLKTAVGLFFPGGVTGYLTHRAVIHFQLMPPPLNQALQGPQPGPALQQQEQQPLAQRLEDQGQHLHGE